MSPTCFELEPRVIPKNTKKYIRARTARPICPTFLRDCRLEKISRARSPQVQEPVVKSFPKKFRQSWRGSDGQRRPGPRRQVNYYGYRESSAGVSRNSARPPSGCLGWIDHHTT